MEGGSLTELPDIAGDPAVLSMIALALEEDLGAAGDVTTASLVPRDTQSRGEIIARNACVVSGTTVASAVFSAVDDGLKVQVIKADGSHVKAGDILLAVEGAACSILTAERTALNFMQRMCGIATRTAQFVEKAGAMMVLDTRKTTPCMRSLEKYAVLCGGGCNHRYGLYDRVLIKDNHRKLWGRAGLGEAVKAARKHHPDLQIEIEVESIEELRDALTGRPDWVLLDNMPSELMRQCAILAAGKCKLEASGGIGLERIEEISRTGVDAVSLGCLTHSVVSADLSLELVEGP